MPLTPRSSFRNGNLTTPPPTPTSASSKPCPAVSKPDVNPLTPPTSPVQIQAPSSRSQLLSGPTSEDPGCCSPSFGDGGIQAPNEAQSDSDSDSDGRGVRICPSDSSDRGVRICPFQVDLVRDSQGQSQVFGYGAWSVVLKGTCQAGTVLNGPGSPSPPLSPTKPLPVVVAVKRPARIDAIPILENEARVLTYLSQIHNCSNHVVTFYGSLAPEHPDLVLEALPVSLEEYIKRCASVARRTLTTWNMSQPVVGSSDVWLSLAETLIGALTWLHDEAGVVHGDIKPGNFVLKQIERAAYDQTTTDEDEDDDDDESSSSCFAFQPLFIDFSSSHRLDTNNSTNNNKHPGPLNTLSAVTREYTAPELLVSSVLRDPTAQATKQSDVFSLAITLLVAATGNTMVYPGSVFQRQAMATRGWQVLDLVRSSGDAIEHGGARVPRHGVVDRALDRAVLKAANGSDDSDNNNNNNHHHHHHGGGAGRISARNWLQLVQQMRRREPTTTKKPSS